MNLPHREEQTRRVLVLMRGIITPPQDRWTVGETHVSHWVKKVPIWACVTVPAWYAIHMTKTTAAQALRNSTIAAQDALGIDREAAFDLTIAVMISEDADTMRAFLAAAHKQYLREAVGA